MHHLQSNKTNDCRIIVYLAYKTINNAGAKIMDFFQEMTDYLTTNK
jgi:hypothetical protein